MLNGDHAADWPYRPLITPPAQQAQPEMDRWAATREIPRADSD